MKLLITFSFILLTFANLTAQINGNGNLITKTYPLDDFYRFEAGFYADITVDMNLSEGITIVAEKNIIEYISKFVKNGVLSLEQTKWIEPSKRIKITIGAPDLREVMVDMHDELKVINVKGKLLKLEANIGKIIVSGKVDKLSIKAESGEVDASNLLCEDANVLIKEDGKVIVNASTIVKCDIKKDGSIENLNAIGVNCEASKNKVEPINTKYIDFKIKNNSLSRKHFVVVGPKPDGNSFSYGFPMMPGAKRNETWTIGTKIYQENSVGIRNLLVTITEKDEKTIVNLFD